MPSRPIIPNESFADLGFPQKGIDLSQGFDSQIPGTTPLATNVRYYEALTQRGRGGSRAGITQYIAEQLPGRIQHVNIIVDPTTDATLDNFDDPNGIDDPSNAGPSTSWARGTTTRNPGRKVRVGGHGRQSNKQPKKKKFAFVQAMSNHDAAIVYKSPITLASDVTKGNLIIVFGNLTDDPSSSPVPTDTLGTVYTFLRGDTTYGPPMFVGMWYGVATATGTCTITLIDQNGFEFQGAIVAEYSGNAASPLDASNSGPVSQNIFPAATPATYNGSTGNVAVAISGYLIVAAAITNRTGVNNNATDYRSIAGDAAFHTRLTTNTLTEAFPVMLLQDQLNAAASADGTTTISVFGANSANDTDYVVSIGASFKPK